MTAQLPQKNTSKQSGFHAVLKLMSKLPMSVIQSIALLAAMFFNLSSGKIKKTIQRNLLIAFPEWNKTQRDQMTKLAIKSQLQSMFEFIKCWGSSPSYSIQQIKQIHGESLFHEAIAAQQGVILVTPHFGTWELMNAWCSQFAPMVIMYKPDEHEAINQFVLEARSGLNATLVPADDTGVRQVYKALKQEGGVTAMLPDHLPEPSGGIFSPFFGCPVLTGTLVSRMAQKTQCTVLLMSCIRNDEDHGFDIYFEKINDSIKSTHLQESVDTLNQAMEQLIRRAPQHYHWTYKRFKADPLLDQAYYVDDLQALELVKQAKQQYATKAHSE
jgi:KDO2-lipid IV(A) lauroyltransferase